MKDRFTIDGFIRLFPYQQHVFRCVFHFDKLHHLGLITIVFQNQSTDRVGDHHRLTFQEDAVARDGVDFARAFHLLTDLLVATWGANNQFSPCLDARSNGIVGGRVSCVKGYQHIQFLGSEVLNTAFHEFQAL